MLTVNVENVCRLIELAQLYHAQEGMVIPDEMDTVELERSVSVADSPADDAERQLMAGHGDQTTFQEFAAIINELEPDQQQEIVALMWLGREDYAVGEWDAILEQARDQWTPETAGYLIEHPLLASYLEDGLAMHGLSCTDATDIGEPRYSTGPDFSPR